MTKLNYLAILTALATSLVANAEDPRDLPIVACYSSEAVEMNIGFYAYWQQQPTGRQTPSMAADSACADVGAVQQKELGKLTIDAARGTSGVLSLYPVKGEDAAGVNQECTITIKDWPSKEKPNLYIYDYNKLNPNVEDFGPKNAAGEGLFQIECAEITSDTYATYTGIATNGA